ncbi:MAG: tRNA (adenosine(37)-N6)-dimethylallyltransferase MiaA, partial [Ignavibacteriales bacterium]|nr:tRNA (adenosine(37)-N6)-dimethylallyltransferase MiaA [Ignavibacteriales bacterium]
MSRSSSASNTSPFSRPEKSVLVIVGPTASGKTPIALQVASQHDGEIISADSRQIYKFMDIGTAKPSPEDRRRVKHYFVDDLNPDQWFNAGEFGMKGREVIDEIVRRDKTPIVVGGSGLYVQALVDGFFEGPGADPEIRNRLEDRIRIEGAERVLDEVRRIDPAAAATMLPSNTRRIVRALEVYQITGVPISQLQKSRVEINFQSVFVGLWWERKHLYERINTRVDRMLERGLIDEVKMLQEKGYSPKLTALQTVGYKEGFEFLRGEIDYDHMVFLMKRNSRRYAKRQLTWFRSDTRIRWFNIHAEDDFPRIASEICNYYSQ